MSIGTGKGLILTRRVGETIVINDNIRITNLGIKGHQCRLHINAPRDLEVHRQEIWERIQKDKAGIVVEDEEVQE